MKVGGKHIQNLYIFLARDSGCADISAPAGGRPPGGAWRPPDYGDSYCKIRAPDADTQPRPASPVYPIHEFLITELRN